MSSTLDELEEIERAARVGRVSPPPPAGVVKGDRRRGSSTFAPPTSASMMGTKASASDLNGGKGEMLEDFPTRNEPMDEKPSPPPNTQRNVQQPAPVKPPENVPRPTAPAVKRGSVALKPMAGLGGLVDFDDSDFDDSDEEMELALPGAPLPGAPMPGSAEMVGGPNHRPLVGGFAAAAYEAARAHHYQSLNKAKPVEVVKRQGPPPSI